MSALRERTSRLLRVGGLELEVERRGRGTPLLVLYGEEALELDSPVLAELANDHELIIPSPPGFGRSERPDWIETPDDISYVYLDLVESLRLPKLPAIGFSLGGWIALEMAVRSTHHLRSLTLISAAGIHVKGVPIVLQKSQIDSRRFFREKTKQAAIVDGYGVKFVSEVACEFIAVR